jgi:hypothetical protein
VNVTRLFGAIGATLGSAAGWWLGNHVGLMTAVVASAVGTGVGLWAGVRFATDHFG